MNRSPNSSPQPIPSRYSSKENASAHKRREQSEHRYANRLITTNLSGRKALYQGIYFLSVAAIGLTLCIKMLISNSLPDMGTTALLAVLGLISYHLPVSLPSGVQINPGFPLLMAALFRHGIACAIIVIVPSMLLHFWTRNHGLTNCLFNAGQFTLSLYAAMAVGMRMGWRPGIPATDKDVVTIILMILSYDVVNNLFLTGANLFENPTSFTQSFAKTFFTDRKWVMGVRTFLTVIAMVLCSYMGNLVFLIVFIGVMVLRRQNEFQKELIERTRESLTDPLTGVYNVRYVRMWIETEFPRLAAKKEPCAILFIDVDNLKHINDVYGHEIGNCLLRHLSEVMRKNIRGEDILARYGGDEFIILCPGTDARGGFLVGERILSAAQSQPVCSDEVEIALNLSLGVASWPAHGDTPYDVIRMADKAMYLSKRRGGNRVMLADEL